MLVLERSRPQQSVEAIYDPGYSIQSQAPFPGLTMDTYDAIDPMLTFNPLPYSFLDHPSVFATEPMQIIKDEMYQFHELPPALVSSGSAPSIASAASSTIGSPYSGPSHTMSSQEGYEHSASYGLGVMPAILSHDTFHQDLLGAPLEAELIMPQNNNNNSHHDKLSPDSSYVGECADLSSYPTPVSSTTIAQPKPRFGHMPPPDPPSRTNHGAAWTSVAEVLSIPARSDSGVSTRSLAVSTPAPAITQSPAVDQAVPVFKSPSTPASARSRRFSPIVFPINARAQPSFTEPNHMVPNDAGAATCQPSVTCFQSHFFAQSSGSFVPPLESSYPSLIHASRPYGETLFLGQGHFTPGMNTFSNTSPSISPVPSPRPYGIYPSGQFSDPLANNNNYQPPPHLSRRPSLASYVSNASHSSPTSELDEDGREKGRCPHPDCGRFFKDLKAHMLTHQAERPEKCPIVTCEYNQKGFARKYDKNRHTLTHYKGTMVCGFCPGSGSPAEKSFNRADVFKRHLTSVHGVDQTAPNSRKRSPSSQARRLSSYCQDATGKCSTCSATFSNAQDFYEHLDDCVLRVVQQEEPSEAINAQHLSSIDRDSNVQQTLDRHMLKTEDGPAKLEDVDDDDDDDDDQEDEEEEDPSLNSRSGKGSLKTTRPAVLSRVVLAGGVSKSTKSAKKRMTWSKGGVALVGKGSKRRKHYPPSWGMSAEKMRMKKRVLCVYDGPRRLWKDDIMLHNEFEVRMSLPDGKSYVTDLDVETLKRAEAFHNASPEEKGPWLPPTEDDGQGVDLNALMA
ncbi:hypothetical protein A1O3_09463 [Capronia epimyces CBS 606.96]|uniref:C2H2-type domain-containing protein n=1 Tax=Capronia epimyces CBS 606.96 TaxID=1182542 RepID=W9XCT5_9EURO|nr:uncharacterized protein A1O3_09463 [Capronia epimyces CBS 606.96]EXJ78302.1 hypothetical protein A1O3_09463 [Capronia epimyces CBS 606.96]